MADWQPIASAPRDGAEIEVGHSQAPGYVGTASWTGDRWQCSIAFVDAKHGRLYWQPDIWRPKKLER